MVDLIVSGGGTGGHIYPAIAVAKEAMQLEPETRVMYVGGKGRREASIVPKFGLDFVPILVESFPRSLSLRWFKVALKVPLGFLKSLRVLRKFSPDVVVGTGGYVCGPVLLGAKVLRIPILIQEQNAMPGITSRFMGRWADEIHVPFEDAAKFFPDGRTRITGNPIRPEIASVSGGREKLGLDKEKLTISFLGGSQGASSINKAAVEALKLMTDFSSQIQIIHQTGEPDFPAISEAYDKLPFESVVQPYFHSIEYVYNASDLVVCRSGAMTLAEVTTCGLPAVLIPYPFSAGDHQTYNALALEKNGAAVMIRDNQLTGQVLADILEPLIGDKKKLSLMAEKSRSMGDFEGTRKIAQAALALAHTKSKKKAS